MTLAITLSMLMPSSDVWTPYWPYSLEGYDPIVIGYGDWAHYSEGPHPGVDIREPSGEIPGDPVFTPNAAVGLCIGAYRSPIHVELGWEYAVGESERSVFGWGLGHLDSIAGLPVYGGAVPARMLLGDAIPQNAPAFTHVHLSWVEGWEQQPQGQFDGLLNPFDYLAPDEAYDRTLFRVPFSPHIAALKGIWFSPDGYELPVFDSPPSFDYPGDWLALQDAVWGKVDAAVRPVSAFEGDPTRDSCGVRQVEVGLLLQEPSSGEYELVADYGWRQVVSMCGILPSGDTPARRALFLDGQCVGDTDTLPASNFLTTYIVTNSAHLAFGQDGWDNIWAVPYNRTTDFESDQYCRGAWDTRLLNPALEESLVNNNLLAFDNSQALFPDGRYVFEVTAVSQGSQDEATAFLPTNDLSDPDEENALGVIVDNYAPYVDSVIAFSYPVFSILYTGGWHEAWAGSDAFRVLLAEELGYYKPTLFSLGMGVAVHYSERIDVARLDQVRLLLVCGSDTLWNSSLNRETWFAPMEQMDPHLNVARVADQGQWQSYALDNPIEFPSGYRGRLLLSFGDYPATRPDGPHDLAGNELDPFPATMAMRDTISGDWLAGSFEAGTDTCNSWGIASYHGRNEAGDVLGSVCGEHIEIPVDEELQAAELIGNCPWLCGFWMFRQDIDEEILRCFAVRPNGYGEGSHVAFDIPTLYENIGWPYPELQGSFASHCLSMGSYFWCTVENVSVVRSEAVDRDESRGMGYSFGHIVCVDCVGGVVLDQPVFEGGGIGPGGNIYVPYFLFLTPKDGISDSVAVTVRYPTGTYPEYTDSLLYFCPPGNDAEAPITEALERHERPELATPLAPPSLQLLTNPAVGAIDFVLESIQADQVGIQLVDLAGRVVMRSEISASPEGMFRGTMDTANLPAGLYVLRATSGETILQTSVVILR